MTTVVEVEWIDSAVSHGWTNDYGSISRITSVGYVVEDNENQIVITESVDHEPRQAKYGCTMAIPRSAIQKVRVLRK